MEVRNNIFVDANFFIALFNHRDSLYKQALSIAADLEKCEHKLTISNYIFLEVVTVLSQKTSRVEALQVGHDMLAHPNITMVHIDEILQQSAWEIFQKVEHKDVSFVDCSIITIMRAENIKILLTFDSHFKQLRVHYRFQLFDFNK